MVLMQSDLLLYGMRGVLGGDMSNRFTRGCDYMVLHGV